MSNNDIEYDIVVNGKPAEKSIREVEDAQNDLDKTVGKTSKNIQTDWRAIGAAAAAAALAIGALMKSALDLERATFGLTKQTKEYIRNASEQYAVSQTVIAGYVQMGKAAGLSGDMIKKMIDQGVALGRSYPHEATETMIDALKEFYATGKEAGFVVDVLEDKMGIAWVETATFAEKMEVLEKATNGVNAEFDKTRAASFDKTLQGLKNETVSFGDSLWDLADSSGALWAVQKGLLGLQLAANGYAQALALAKTYASVFGVDTQAAEADLKRLAAEAMNIRKELGGGGGTDRPNDLGTIDIIGSTNKPKGSFTGGAASKTADKERAIALAANERFWDEYNKTIMSATQLELDQLNKKYVEYKKSVTDKVALEEWFAKETQRILDEQQKQTDEYAQLKEQVFDGLTDSFVEFAMTGKATFEDMAQSIIAQLIKIQIQSLIVQSIGGTSLGGLFGLHTGASEVKHSGGNIGALPSYHSGLRGDERMAKLQVGEAVINRSGAANNQEAIKQMNAGERVGGGGDNITTAEIKFEVQAIDAASFDSYLVNNRKTIESIISNSISSNGPVRKTIKQSI